MAKPVGHAFISTTQRYIDVNDDLIVNPLVIIVCKLGLFIIFVISLLRRKAIGLFLPSGLNATSSVYQVQLWQPSH